MTRETGIVIRNDGDEGEVRAHFEKDRVCLVRWRGGARWPVKAHPLLYLPRSGLDALVTEALRRGGE